MELIVASVSEEYLDSKICTYFGIPSRKGDVGIEIEAEVHHTSNNRLKHWNKTTDGSLRGTNYELVLRNPIKMVTVPAALDEAYNFLDDVRIRQTDNCGVHVHLNCTNYSIQETINILVGFTILEPLLLSMCNEHRQGNYFCLSALDAQMTFNNIRSFAKGSSRSLNDNAKYSGINLSSLPRFGSIELRHLEFPVDKEHLLLWATILHEIKINFHDLASHDDSDVIFRRVSEMGLEDFIAEYAPTLYSSTTITPDILSDCTLSMRKCQPAIYDMIKYRKTGPDPEEQMSPYRQAADRLRTGRLRVSQDNANMFTVRVDNNHITWEGFDTPPNPPTSTFNREDIHVRADDPDHITIPNVRPYFSSELPLTSRTRPNGELRYYVSVPQGASEVGYVHNLDTSPEGGPLGIEYRGTNYFTGRRKRSILNALKPPAVRPTDRAALTRALSIGSQYAFEEAYNEAVIEPYTLHFTPMDNNNNEDTF